MVPLFVAGAGRMIIGVIVVVIVAAVASIFSVPAVAVTP